MDEDTNTHVSESLVKATGGLTNVLENLTNDKALVIIAVTILGVLSLSATLTPGQTQIVSNVISGLFGVAVGTVLSKN